MTDLDKLMKTSYKTRIVDEYIPRTNWNFSEVDVDFKRGVYQKGLEGLVSSLPLDQVVLNIETNNRETYEDIMISLGSDCDLVSNTNNKHEYKIAKIVSEEDFSNYISHLIRLNFSDKTLNIVYKRNKYEPWSHLKVA